MRSLKSLFISIIAILLVLCFAPNAWAFCGFYVSKADAKLYNKASQVVLARDGDRTVLTMANDYQGDVKDFALVVPVPSVIKQEQVSVSNPKIIERLDAFSAPRLVEYFDADPCAPPVYPAPPSAIPESSSESRNQRGENSLGVTVEAKFTVGEYDIVILSAKESNGLETWLNQNGYKIPRNARQLFRPYIRQNMKFFVAKVNLEQFDESGNQFLRPLQISYNSAKFMLPIRLGTINSQSEQDLIVYLLSPKGQIELTNYRTVKIPSNSTVPLFVKDEFGDFYKAMFQNNYEREDKKVAFLEYAWNIGSCDPCSADPLNPQELKEAGVFWLNSDSFANTFITRLHVRYTRNKFPEDLIFQETSNSEFFQGRYILQHPFTGEMKCEAANNYQKLVRDRQEQEAQTLAQLTGWNIRDIRRKVEKTRIEASYFWRNIWNNFN
jgi:hypothetical protein